MKQKKDLYSKIDSVIGKNSLVLFDINGKPMPFSYQRHICDDLKSMPGESTQEKTINSVIIAIHLWYSWDAHIRNSTYPLEWYGCVQIENEWLEGIGQTPPYVIFDSINPQKIQNFNRFAKEPIEKIPFWEHLQNTLSLKSTILKKAEFDDKSIVWRICYPD